jgi:hypothetical protein
MKRVTRRKNIRNVLPLSSYCLLQTLNRSYPNFLTFDIYCITLYRYDKIFQNIFLINDILSLIHFPGSIRMVNEQPIARRTYAIILKTKTVTKNKQTPRLCVRTRTIPTIRSLQLPAKLVRVEVVVLSVQRVPMAVNLGFLTEAATDFPK